MNLDTDLISFTKSNTKWNTDLNVRCKTMKLLRYDDFFRYNAMAYSIKEVIGMLDYIKIKNCCSVKDNFKRMRRQTKNWEKIFAKDTSDKRLLSKIYKEHL